MTAGRAGPSGTPPGPRRGGSLTDVVMARVAREPTPSPGRVFIRSLRRLALRDALAALATAMRLAFEPAAPVAGSARASAAAVFLSVIVLVGVGGAFVASGVIGVLGPDDPRSVQPAPAAAPSATPAPLAVPEVTPTPTPTAKPTPVRTPQPSAQPQREQRTQRETPEPRERKSEKKERRETPEPREREREEEDDRENDD